MEYISLFAGIGGFDLALNRNGHKCVYANEWDKYAAAIYEKNFKHKPDTRDITTIRADEIPDHDLLVGGFPCQSFSIAGKRGGFEDTRGTLFFEICRILRAKRTAYFLLENVKGLLSHDGGRTFYTIISSLDELGYDCQWQVLNSKNFGVPQNRERVFIIGHLRGKPRPKVFPLEDSYGNSINQLNQPTHSNDRIYEPSGIAPIPNTAQGGRRRPMIAPTMRANHHNPADVHFVVERMPLKFLKRNQKNIDGDYAFTVDGANTGGVKVSKTISSGGRKSPHSSKQNWDSYEVGNQIRRLTPLECERLQGFPDGWTEGISDTQRYKCLGNAVTVNVVEAIINKLTQ